MKEVKDLGSSQCKRGHKKSKSAQEKKKKKTPQQSLKKLGFLINETVGYSVCIGILTQEYTGGSVEEKSHSPLQVSAVLEGMDEVI